MTAPLLVLEFDLGGARPSPREFVAEAAARGARFVACDVVDGDDEIPEARLGGRLVAGLARLADEAARRQVGLFLRLSDTLAVHGLADALGAAKGTSAAKLRERVLVVVDGERTGKRLRRIAPELPSALELAVTRRGMARFLSANVQRAAADADDLVVPWSRPGAERLIVRIAPTLARRGGRVWASGVPPADVADASALPVAGVVVRADFADAG